MTYRFNGFTLDTDTRRLMAGAREIPLFPKAFDLLLMLLESRPRVLSKTELHERLWPGTYVSDSNLSGLIRLIRDALDDDPQHPRLIRTAHRVGYAFAGEAEVTAPAQSRRTRVECGYWLTLPNRQYALKEGENIVGRDPDAEVPLLFPGVSRRHARVTVERGRVTVEDLGSKNGTAVNGERVVQPSELHDGNEVMIGPITLAFRASALGASTATQTTDR